MPRKTLVFVPTYNECDNAERMVREIVALGLESDLLFMDDGSPDGTGKILDSLAAQFPQMTVIHRAAKQGIGTAHRDAIAWAYDHGYELLITLDCDFTHQPTDIHRLLEALSGHDLATGSRYLAPDSLPNWNLVRRMLTGVGHFLTKRFLAIKYDATGAFRAYDLTRIARRSFSKVKSPGYGYFFESMFVLVGDGYTVGEFPIVLSARTYGHSKMTFGEAVRSGTRLLKLSTRRLVDRARE